MRRYIRNEQLKETLQLLTASDCPELKAIYHEVVLLRASRNAKAHSLAAKMLLTPRLIMLSTINLFALVFSGVYFESMLSGFTSGLLSISFECMVTLFALFESVRLTLLIGALKRSMPYLLIDELFCRRILVLQKKQRASSASHSA